MVKLHQLGFEEEAVVDLVGQRGTVRSGGLETDDQILVMNLPHNYLGPDGDVHGTVRV